MEEVDKIDRLRFLFIADASDQIEPFKILLNSIEHPSYQIHMTKNLSEGFQALTSDNFDLIFLELFLTDSQQTESVAKIKSTLPADIPVIVILDKDDSSLILECIGKGAFDYFCIKDMNAHDLWGAVYAATAIHQRTRETQKSKEKFRTIIETLEDGYYETDLEGCYTYVNKTYCGHLQQLKEEIIGRPRREDSSPHTVENLERVLKEVLLVGMKDSIVEDEILRKDGSILHAELSIMLMRDPTGDPIGYSCISRDVTEKRQAEKVLAANEKKYRNILDNIQEAYFESDLKGRLLFFNDVLADYMGYSKEELLGMSYLDQMDKENAEKLYKAYHQIYRTGQPIRSLQFEITAKNGNKIKSIESSVALMKDNDGRPIGFRGLARDITKRKQNQQELESAKAKAEEATLAKSRFLSNMSHEIRTPLNAVVGMYHLLLGTDLTTEQADFVAAGKRSADSLLVVINDILDFSKIESGQLDIEIIDFDLYRNIQDLSALTAMQAHAKGLEFFYRIGTEVPALLKGDPVRLRQIITNLCTNGIKFTQNGEIVLTIDLVNADLDGVKLRFAVKDTGIGISKADQLRLFHSFQQADASTTRKYGGTGLGLAISKRLTEMMGGEMGVESDNNQGATFWFTAIFAQQTNGKNEVYDIPQTLKEKRILIVDDNQTHLDILDGYLRHWGCVSDLATSGEMALALMTAVAKTDAPFDIVISDMHLPVMDGAELGRRIKADPSLTGTRLIMLTPQGLRKNSRQMERIGFQAYLTKPVGRSQLLACLMSVINDGKIEFVDFQTDSTDRWHAALSTDQKSARILLAEDNLVNQKLALHMLTQVGFSVTVVSNGRLAVEALQQENYDLVLMDIQMPEMDGLEAVRIIRDPGSKVLDHMVPIIAVTAHAMKGDREKFLKAGINAYISKPIQPDILFESIGKVQRQHNDNA